MRNKNGSKARPEGDELARILKAWASGEITIKDLAKRFQRSTKVLKEIVQGATK
jgi:hypothetical protein